MQYPVFPFILNQYEGNYLDLNDPQSYRKLNKPIACQHIENEAKFKQHYEVIVYQTWSCPFSFICTVKYEFYMFISDYTD